MSNQPEGILNYPTQRVTAAQILAEAEQMATDAVLQSLGIPSPPRQDERMRGWSYQPMGNGAMSDTLIPVLDSPNVGGPRECEYPFCKRPLPADWPAVYCGNSCAIGDSGYDDLVAAIEGGE